MEPIFNSISRWKWNKDKTKTDKTITIIVYIEYKFVLYQIDYFGVFNGLQVCWLGNSYGDFGVR